MDDPITGWALPASMFSLMIGMGLTLTLDDFRRIERVWRTRDEHPDRPLHEPHDPTIYHRSRRPRHLPQVSGARPARRTEQLTELTEPAANSERECVLRVREPPPEGAESTR